jgi:uncharacterized protein (TIGR03435 family)
MKRHDESIEDVLGNVLRSTPQQEMEAAGTRVLERLRWEGKKIVESSVPERATSRQGWKLMTAAAAVVCAVALSIVFWQGGSAAVITAADHGLYRVVGKEVKPVKIGEEIDLGETIRSDGASSATLTLQDGARIEMRAKSELAFEDAQDGLRIRLDDGSVIVSAAEKPRWHLYVQTKDARVSLTNTVSLVTAEEAGSRVAVIQGEARVEQGGIEKWLRRGEQLGTVPSFEPRSIAERISWSSRAGLFLPMLQQAVEAVTPPPPQNPAVPKWEAVAIRPCDPNATQPPGARGNNGVGENFTVTPGRFSTECMRLGVLINLAYVSNGEPLSNSQGMERKDSIKGPEWIHSGKLSDRYSIEAKAEGAPEKKTILGPMLRALLEERFKLKTHRETEDTPMFGLVVAKNGLKIKPFNTADCTPNDNAGFRVWVDQVRRGERGFCSFVYGDDAAPGITGWAFGGTTLTNFAGTLSRWVSRPVVDQTGIPGTFRFYLEVDSSISGVRIPDGPDGPIEIARPPDTPRGPDIFSAIQDQLGLRLVDGVKGQHQFIVVDHAERPSEN